MDDYQEIEFGFSVHKCLFEWAVCVRQKKYRQRTTGKVNPFWREHLGQGLYKGSYKVFFCIYTSFKRHFYLK